MKNNSSLQKLANYINGEFTPTKNYLENFNPALGIPYSLCPSSDASEVKSAIAAAKNAFPVWSKTSNEERANFMLKIAAILENKMEAFAKAESIDQGKTYTQALQLEIPRAIRNFKFFANRILQNEQKAYPSDGNILHYVQKKPVGVAALISPWNLPLYLITWKIAPAIAAGNTVVCKPSELTPMTAYLLGEVLTKAALPPGVCNIVHGLGSQAGQTLLEHEDIPLISFTGGTETGKHVAATAAKNMKRLSLELGGKNPALIFADCNLEETIATTVRSSFQNQGEICLCNSRVYVEESIYNKFLEGFLAATKKLVAGDPLDAKSFLGPVISKAHQEKIFSYIELAKKENAQILCGGTSPSLEEKFANGYFISPTIITDIEQKSRVVQEEIFGPVVTILPFKTEAEAIALANDTRYGLSASIFTQNIGRAHNLAQQLDAGTIWINSWMIRDLRVPFGGMKASGIGREGGDYSLDFFSNIKDICLKL